MKTIKIELVIERSEDGSLWGRVNWNDNLIVENEKKIPALEIKMKSLLQDFEGLEPDTVEFIHLYDIYSLFQRFDFLKISSIAGHAGMNPSLLRQYASG